MFELIAMTLPARHYRYLDLLINTPVVVLVVSNLITPKSVPLGLLRCAPSRCLAVLATPLTYWVVKTLARREGVHFFDRSTNLNPFASSALVATTVRTRTNNAA